MPINYNAVGLSQLWRRNYELYAASAWSLGAAGYAAYAAVSDLPAGPSLAVSGVCAAMSAVWWPRAISLWNTQRNLAGRPLSFCTFEELKEICADEDHKGEMWMGRGFLWEKTHTQRAYDILGRDWGTISRDASETEADAWLRKQKERKDVIRSFLTRGKRLPSETVAKDMGQPWIHGLEPREIELWQPMKHVEGHCLIVGTTGAGKAQPYSAKVLTPSGWTTMGAVKKGTAVVTPRGTVAHVIGVYDRGVRDMRRVVTADGRMTTACTEHLWAVYVTDPDMRARTRELPMSDILTGKLFKAGIKPKDLQAHMVSASLPDVTIDLLGIRPAVVTTWVLEHFLKCGLTVEIALPKPVPAVSRPKIHREDARYFTDALLGNKLSDAEEMIFEAVIGPCRESDEELLKAKIAEFDSGTRAVLLEALVKRAKTVVPGISGSFSVLEFKSPYVLRIARELARSLGRLAYADSETRLRLSPEYEILGHNLVNEIQLRLSENIPHADEMCPVTRVELKLITEAPAEPARCIQLDDAGELYVTDDWIVTHNTRMFDLLISQAILRGETVFIVDPKGDRELMMNAKRACENLGRPQSFYSFHPAMPEESIKIDLLANWTRVSEIPSRIASLITTSGAGQSFKDFGWRVMEIICEGLHFLDRRPTLVLMRRYLEGGVEPLFIKVMDKYATEVLGAKEYKNAYDSSFAKLKQYATPAKARAKVYEDYLAEYRPNIVVEGLKQMTEHDAAHASKMLASLLPIMTKLTSGKLGTLLSPPERKSLEDDDDPYLDTAQLIAKNGVVYIGLDALSDNTVASAIGSLILADLTAVAGGRYNFEESTKPVNVFVDEAAEVLNEPMIQMLNKGRGAKLRLFVATQTLSDLAAKLGSKDMATQVVANVNNTIALRLNDRETQEYISERMPKTRVSVVEHAQSQSMNGDEPLLHGGSLSERLTHQEVEMVPPALFGLLPNLEFFAVVSGGRILKSRVPILIESKDSDKK